MDPSYIGVVWLFGGNFAPVNFNFCDGSLQSIAENEALFTLLGTTYGGDGVSTFGLPDLRGRAAVGQGTGVGLSTYVLGQRAGAENVTLTTSNLAAHTHLLNVGSAAGTTQTPGPSVYISALAAGGQSQSLFSSSAPNEVLAPGTIANAGNSIPIQIVQPSLAISYIIALFGIFPSQN